MLLAVTKGYGDPGMGISILLIIFRKGYEILMIKKAREKGCEISMFGKKGY